MSYCEFYYSDKYGVGFGGDAPQGAEISLFFEDGERHTAVYENLIALTPFLRRNAYGYGYYITRQEFNKLDENAKTLCWDGKVVPLKSTKSDKMISFRIDDKKPYTVKIGHLYHYTEFKTSCTCGSRPYCAHIRAVEKYMRQHIKLLRDLYISAPGEKDRSFFISTRLEDLLHSFLNSDDPADEKDTLRQIISEIRLHPTADYIAAALEYSFGCGEDAYYLEDIREAVTLFTYSMFTDEILGKVLMTPTLVSPYLARMYNSKGGKALHTAYKNAVRECLAAEQEMQKDNFMYTQAKHFMIMDRGDLLRLLKYLAEDTIKLTLEGLNKIGEIDETDKTTAVDPEIRLHTINKILKKLDELDRNNDKVRTAFKKLVQLLPEEDRVFVLSGLRNLSISFDEYKILNKSDKVMLAFSMPANAETIQYILNDVLADESPRNIANYIISALNKIYPIGARRALRPLIMKTVDRLPASVLLREFLDDKLFMIYYEGKDWSIELSREDYLTYCSFGADVYVEGDDAVTVYSCWFEEAVQDDDMPIYEVNGSLSYTGEFIRRFTHPSLELIRELCLENDGENIRRKQEEAIKEIGRRRFAQENRTFIEDYERLRRNLGKEKVVLNEQFRAHVTYFLYKGERDYNGDEEYLLGFKIGNVKNYIVKNAEEFLYAFVNKKTVTYGKDLVLTHDYANLCEEDRGVIQMLSSLRLYNLGNTNKKYVTINKEALINFLEMMKGRQMYFEDEPCTVRLEKKPVNIRIDKDYQLQGLEEEENCSIFTIGERGYILDRTAKVLDEIEGDADHVRVAAFCCNHRGISIKPILDEFKKDIYAANFNTFDVDAEVAPDFKLSTIKIKAYFDYDDKKIFLKEELLKDDKKIKRGDIKERADADRLGSFDAYIKNLGFEDNVLSDDSRIMSFLKMDFSGIKKLANIYLSENLSNKSVLAISRSVVRINKTGTGLMEAIMEKSDYSEEELEKILTGIRKKKKFIFLDKNRIVDLDSSEAKELGEVVKDLGLEPGKLYQKKRISMVNALKAFAHTESCSVDKHLRSMLDEIKNFKDYEVPDPGTALPLRSYQMDGYRWLSVLSKYGMGGILADDMGLGKTLQIISLIKNDNAKAPSLIVCPKSLVFNWINEFAKFDGVTETREIYGLAQSREGIIKDIDYKKKVVYVTSYDSLRNDIAAYTGKFAYCILDEAQFIKNVDAQKSKSVKEINAAHKFALTGTPIENNVVDLWSIFDFIMPGYFEELSDFRAEYNRDPAYTAKIAKRIGPFVLRRVKENVLGDLPDKYEKIISTEMTPQQRKLYDAVRKKAKTRLEEGGKAFDLLPYLTQMRQICVDPAMCFDDKTAGSGKLQLLSQLIPEYLAAGHRILIFSQFVKGLNQVETCLKELRIGYYMITGDTAAKARIDMIDDFNAGSDVDVFLISLKAGGTGINLTGADTVIHLDPWWNVAAENQATDRAHRIGQTKNVEVIKLISEDSIEQRVLELQNMKKDLFDRIISSDERSVTGASLEDIAFILK